MNQNKLKFLSTLFVPLLNNLQSDAVGKWGKMNGQQMVEHVAGTATLLTMGKKKYN